MNKIQFASLVILLSFVISETSSAGEKAHCTFGVHPFKKPSKPVKMFTPLLRKWDSS